MTGYESQDVIIESGYKNIYELTTRKKISEIDEDNKFPIHKKTLKDVTFWSIFLEATEKTQMPFLNRAIKDTYIENNLVEDADFIELVKDKVLSATSVNGKNVDRVISQDFLYELANYLENNSLKQVANYFKENLNGGNENISFYLENNIQGNYSGDLGFINKVNNQFATVNNVGLSDISL